MNGVCPPLWQRLHAPVKSGLMFSFQVGGPAGPVSSGSAVSSGAPVSSGLAVSVAPVSAGSPVSSLTELSARMSLGVITSASGPTSCDCLVSSVGDVSGTPRSFDTSQSSPLVVQPVISMHITQTVARFFMRPPA